ncbi:RNA polymerase Rpb1 domain 5 family protein [Babesia bovis T2Bo]|uniref:DNA-directed RNA polymerase subunit n=1 Tax=Babesia bovis TaxID=5865 RepID=A7ARZ5_BABBO|nr:RNA polymerase Rpb1 domain 5 family protein [Babesia bovis T2Bo]EDO07314.1 RNA polymerase Rpb1 domain 5 family protein [Babesia bovis T2Bo]|eukprot:XP_001610882.1 DNA directed RNA polymerase [Babesia bovis T2Bo]
MMKYETTVSTEVCGLSFEFLSSDAIRALSASEIGNPSHHGQECAGPSCIHDSALGPSDLCNICSTCQDVAACDGHLGHVNFPVPIYHPLLMPRLVKLLKSTCLYCRKLKLTRQRIVKLIKLFDLLHVGLLSDMLLFDEWCPNRSKQCSLEEKDELPKFRSDILVSEGSQNDLVEVISAKEDYLDSVMRKLENRKRTANAPITTSLSDNDLNITTTGTPNAKLDAMNKNMSKAKKPKSVVAPSSTGKNSHTGHFDLTFWNNLRNRFLAEAGAVNQCPHCERKDLFNIAAASDLSSIDISWPLDADAPPIGDFINTFDFNFNDEHVGNNDKNVSSKELQSLIPGVINRLSATGRSIRQVQLQAFQVVPYLKELFMSNEVILGHVFPQTRKMGWKMFVMFCMGVPANRFRPVLLGADRQISLHARTSMLLDIVVARETLCVLLKVGDNSNLKKCMRDPNYMESLFGKVEDRQIQAFRDYIVACGSDFNSAVLNTIQNLQRKVSLYTDSSKTGSTINSKLPQRPGIKQSLEHKEGAVRHNMLGKRVNYAARTVIAPDCFLDSNQMGIPLMFATELTVPENVTSYNVNMLRKLLINGPRIYPGANFYRDEYGKLYNLGTLSINERKAKAKLLLTDISDGRQPRVVYRHVLDGDVVLMNRQPTLHKPGIMAHFVRVLTNQKIFRLNYVNCNTYNADFDGDEMNLHLPQDPLAQSEAQIIANADCQFTVPKDGQPIRGLIQDHCLGGAYLTSKDTFLTCEQYFNLVYVALQEFFKWHKTIYIRSESGLRKMDNGIQVDVQLHQLAKRLKLLSDPYARRCAHGNTEMHVEEPAILFPQRLWTGKQVITTLLKTIVDGIAKGLHMTDVNFLRTYKGINLYSKSKTPGDAWGGANDGCKEESIIIIRNSELLQGVLDKSQFGATPYGLTHLVYELLGPRASGSLLNAFSYLFTSFLQMHGATCSPQDFILTSEAERHRERILRRIKHCGIHLQEVFISALSNTRSDTPMLENGRGRSPEVILSDSLSVFKDILIELKTFPRLKSLLQGIDIKAISDVRDMLKIVSQYLSKNDATPKIQSKLADIVSRAIEALCSVPELRGYLLGQLGNLNAESSMNMPKNDGILVKYFPSWQKEYDADMKMSISKVDRSYILGDSIGTCSSMYRLINEKFKGNEKIFYKMFDRFFQGNITGASNDASTVVDNTLLKFPQNGFASMVLTGAKGSKVNFSMICSILAQQSLEGRRVPVMPSVRTLPSFAFGDLGARAGGFITDRFLTGLRPQEYFFHCMSGREGLVDTCVKTAKSGYLQRCILKAMEDVICCYDATVRSSDGTIIQFSYGEDGIDVQKSAYLKRPNDVIENAALISLGQSDLPLKLEEGFVNLLGNKFTTDDVKATLYRHYKRSQCEPGEAVGCIAGQSIGEPATQMTLNTFHLAGHGATNVTLGIPRLVELMQTTGSASTPYFSAPLLGDSDDNIAHNAQLAINALRNVPLTDVIHSVAVEDSTYMDAKGDKYCEYEAIVQFEDLVAFTNVVPSISIFDILKITAQCLLNGFLKKITGLMIVTMDSHVPYEITEYSDYLQECWRRLVLQETIQRKSKLADRIRRMALNSGGAQGAILKISAKNLALNGEDGPLTDVTSTIGPRETPSEDNDVNEDANDSTEKETQVNDDADDDPDLEKSSDHEDSDPESEVDEDGTTTVDSCVDSDDDNSHNPDSDAEETITASDSPKPMTAAAIALKLKLKGTVNLDGSAKRKAKTFLEFENEVKMGKQAMSSINTKVFHFAKSLRYCETTGRMVLKFGWPFTKCPYHLNLLQLLRQETSSQILRNSPGVKQPRVVCHTDNNGEVYKLHCDGTNLQRLFLLRDGLVDFNRLHVNDIATVYRYYGIEAARASIVSELQNVFSVYGINVDYRHLSLIADFMTNKGDIRTFNRYGMARHASPLLQMSFESTLKFIMDACERGGYDDLGSPAGAIVAGRPIRLGGGLCKVLPQIDLQGVVDTATRYPTSAYDQHMSSTRKMGVESFVLET